MDDSNCNPQFLNLLKEEYAKAKEKKEDKTLFKLKNVLEIVDWKDRRPNLTQDFIDTDVCKTFISAENVPKSYQERLLVSDLLVCFLGGSANYIQAEQLPYKGAERTFIINEQLHKHLYNFAQKCLRLAKYYSQLCRFVEDNRLLSAGRVNQSLSCSIDMTLIEYRSFVVELEKLHSQRNLNIMELWFHIQDVIEVLERLYSIVVEVTQKELRGGATLTYLLECSSNCFTDGSHADLLKYLMKKSTVPYMESVKQWIFNGIIFDPFDEFMIVEKQKTPLKECQSLEQWEKRYQIRKNFVPSFLVPVTNEIWKSGVYLNVIRENVEVHESKLNLAPIEDIKYSLKPFKYINGIRMAYNHASSHLLHLMISQYQLLNRFNFMKRYFLVQQGDFVVQVLDTCNEELSKPILLVKLSRLETFVDMAVKGVDCFLRDDLTIMLHSQDLLGQVSRIHSVSSTFEPDHRNSGLNSNLTGFESFSLSMNCRWPISFIFNARVISSYQMLFRLFFYCKHVEQCLFRAWIIDKRLLQFAVHQSKPYCSIFALRHKMIYFLQNLMYYMLEEVIEPNWIDFQQQVKLITSGTCTETEKSDLCNNTVYSIDNLLDIHKKFLDKCISDCLLSNPTIFPIFIKLLSLCKDFASLMIEHEETISSNLVSDGDNISRKVSDISQKFQEEHILFLKTIANFVPHDSSSTKIIQVLHRANFNMYFSPFL